MVEAIKDSRGLYKNISKYMGSENKHIRYEYDQLRRKTAKVLKRIHRYDTAEGTDIEMRLNKLMALKYRAKQSDVLIDGTLDNLIRDGRIDSQMATSLANDSDNVAGITRNLIRIAELLYIHSDTMLTGVTELSKEEREKFVEPALSSILEENE